jgi:hypothetical protein
LSIYAGHAVTKLQVLALSLLCQKVLSWRIKSPFSFWKEFLVARGVTSSIVSYFFAKSSLPFSSFFQIEGKFNQNAPLDEGLYIRLSDKSRF